MTCPVRRLCGSYYLITRQVAHRELRLRPGQGLEHTLGVIIAHAAEVWAVKALRLWAGLSEGSSRPRRGPDGGPLEPRAG